MSRITKADKEDFAQFCAQASDSQVLSIYEKERNANRRTYAQIAKEEAIRRGLI